MSIEGPRGGSVGGRGSRQGIANISKCRQGQWWCTGGDLAEAEGKKSRVIPNGKKNTLEIFRRLQRVNTRELEQ